MSSRIVAENIRLKRAYNSAGSGDGTRILIDRLWPRGVRKADAAIDVWAKDIAPSTALRRWFGHDPARWHEFRRRYSEEIHRRRDRLDELRTLAQKGRITLVFAARDEAHNDAVVLREILLGRSVPRRPPLAHIRSDRTPSFVPQTTRRHWGTPPWNRLAACICSWTVVAFGQSFVDERDDKLTALLLPQRCLASRRDRP